ncbi:MAG: hypothetical protein ISS49_05100 [Anaerolineae bacterium]|nr:hypothetical protein [Anaerolineae bacterium]
MKAIEYILAIYSWVVIGMLIVFLWRIAYFFERTSGQRVGYRFLILPALLLVAGVVWYLVCGGEFIGQPAGDVLLFSGGVSLCLFGLHLHKLMTGERQ